MFQLQNLSLFVFFLIFAFFTPSISASKIPKHDEPEVRGMFVFGSSLVDTGNNNFLENTLARVDYFPYGYDFPCGPTGRFTNGKNVIDVFAEKLQLRNYIPPFNDPSTRGARIMHGVDFASGSSGILDTTGILARNVTTFSQQIRNFVNVTLPDLEQQLGMTSNEILPDFLFVIGVGGNDYTRNYFMFHYNVTIEEFTNNLTSTLAGKLKTLYNLGARKFVLMSLYPIGCAPMSKPPPGGCVEKYNEAAELYNKNLIDLVDDLPLDLPDSVLVLVNAYNIILDIIQDPTPEGFEDVTSPCCEVGFTGTLCEKGGSACTERRVHVYFDGEHPTEAVNIVLGTKAFSSVSDTEVYPFNIADLINMDFSARLKSRAARFKIKKRSDI